MLEVRLFNAQWEHLPPRLEINLEAREVVVLDLLTRLDLDPAEVGIVTVDGRQSKLDETVPAGSRVCIFPPMFGG